MIAYVMQAEKMGWEAALNYVRERRPVACPNVGFRTQLQTWEQRLRE